MKEKNIGNAQMAGNKLEWEGPWEVTEANCRDADVMGPGERGCLSWMKETDRRGEGLEFTSAQMQTTNSLLQRCRQQIH